MKKLELTIKEIMNRNYEESEFTFAFYEFNMFQELESMRKSQWGGQNTIKSLKLRDYEGCNDSDLTFIVYKDKPFATFRLPGLTVKDEILFDSEVLREFITDYMLEAVSGLTTNVSVHKTNVYGTVTLSVSDEIYAENIQKKQTQNEEQFLLYSRHDDTEPRKVTLNEAKCFLSGFWEEPETDSKYLAAIENADFDELKQMLKGSDYVLERLAR
ncbi:hypothetical protein [Bacillus thuringiensis]|uniref:Uncharacterized protein n=1 Tax=Bacillus thuringiensis TaxID=1428 RepID=A0A9X6ZV08_BACTU|nr:hypothetical protein [Bacillus thuringiensis]PFJ42769.1 hypothetical protein COJ15_05355 [Bacillus thuringiensis]